jgi:predicted XRE-type DNA-binding protein
MESNVFDALGYGREEAANLRLRARLMAAFRRHVQERGLTQAEAAEIIGTSQPRISDLIGGKIDKFTIDFLVNALTSLGESVHLVLGGESAVDETEG